MTIRNTGLVLLLFIITLTNAQDLITKTISSTYLEEERNITIYLPKGYDAENAKNYPLAIVLDQELLFNLYVGNSNLFALKDKAPKQIVVGISMAKTRKKDTYFNIESGNLTADNQKFYQFLRDEVLLEIEDNYKTSPFITMVGYGSAANIVSSFLGEQNLFVNAYICINPIFPTNISDQLNKYNLQRLEKEDNTFYFYTNTTTAFSDKKQIETNQLLNNLKTRTLKNLNFITDTINTKSSISAISEAIPRALTEVFIKYTAISKDEFNTKIKNLSPVDAIAYLENKYLDIEFLFGANIGIRERDIYAIEPIILEKEEGNQLRNFGKMILKIYPSSPLGNYYIGQYYEKRNNIKKALRSYKVGYGKMDPSNPNADAFYENILRLGGQ